MIGENLYCEGNARLTPQFRDGYMRTFTGYPKVNKVVWDMMKKFESPRKLLLFFIEKVTDDEEYAGFLTRDFLNGIWKYKE